MLKATNKGMRLRANASWWRTRHRCVSPERKRRHSASSRFVSYEMLVCSADFRDRENPERSSRARDADRASLLGRWRQARICVSLVGEYSASSGQSNEKYRMQRHEAWPGSEDGLATLCARWRVRQRFPGSGFDMSRKKQGRRVVRSSAIREDLERWSVIGNWDTVVAALRMLETALTKDRSFVQGEGQAHTLSV